jgi:hypothetical protein
MNEIAFIFARCDEQHRLLGSEHLLGSLDMGGGSIQFVSQIRSSKIMDSSIFWIHSWLQYGAESLRERVFLSMLEHSVPSLSPAKFADATKLIPNACIVSGFLSKFNDTISFIGTGDSAECARAIIFYLRAEQNRTAKFTCYSSSCDFDATERIVLDSILPPAVDSTANFIAMSAYFYVLDCLRMYTVGDSLTAWYYLLPISLYSYSEATVCNYFMFCFLISSIVLNQI